jgi:adenylyltransferase/sulfurtransferase
MDRCESLPSDPSEGEITPRELQRLLARSSDVVMLDVREEWEYSITHIEGARLIPLRELPFRLHELDPRSPLVVYCHHGMRSYDATCFLRNVGFSVVKNLAGGIDRWSVDIDATLPRY